MHYISSNNMMKKLGIEIISRTKNIERLIEDIVTIKCDTCVADPSKGGRISRQLLVTV